MTPGCRRPSPRRRSGLARRSARILQASDGLSYAGDPSRPAGDRVDPAGVTLHGTPIAADASYRVTVTSFLADGGSFTVLRQGTDRLGGVVDLDALVDSFEVRSPVQDGPQDHITLWRPAADRSCAVGLTLAQMRICFFGTPQPAVPSLQAFLDAPDVEVAAVITNPDRPSGRGYKLTPPPVKVLAQSAGTAVWQPTKAREILDDLAALEVDACAVVAYGALLPRAVLDAGGRGFVNLHFSLLPRWRGAAPVQHTVLAGDRVTGVTCFVLEEGMDTGPVLASLRTPVGEDETAGELIERLAREGAPVLVSAVRDLVQGRVEPAVQDHDAATLAPKITPDDARLDWPLEASALHRAVRAFNPVPGAWTTVEGDRLKVHRAVRRDTAGHVPGFVHDIGADGPVVACGEGSLELTEVQPAGKPRMSGAAYANGYQPLGKRLGA